MFQSLTDDERPQPMSEHLSRRGGTIARMTQSVTSAGQDCIFCAIVARQAEASVVYEDESVVAFWPCAP